MNEERAIRKLVKHANRTGGLSVGDPVAARTFAKMAGGGGMTMPKTVSPPDYTAPKKKSKRSRAEKLARRAAKAAGVRWKALDKSIRKGLINDAKTARSMEKLVARLHSGAQEPVAPASAPVDLPLAKTILPATAADPTALQGAVDALRKALGMPRVGMGGWR